MLSSGTGGRVLGPMGRILKAVLMSPFVSQTLSLFTQNGSTQTLDELRELIEAGQVTPAIDRTYPLAEVPDAVRYFVEEHAAERSRSPSTSSATRRSNCTTPPKETNPCPEPRLKRPGR